MSFNKYYSIPFKDIAGRSCEVEIYKDATAPVSIIELDGTERPAVTSVTDGDRSLYTPIRGQELTVSFVSNTISITTFVDNSDLKWRANLKVGSITVFIGYLVVDDCQEEFVDYTHVISLKFTDGLALLNQKPIKDGSNDPYGFYSMYDVLRLCLNATGLTLPINVFMDLGQSSTPTSLPIIDSLLYIDAKSLLKDSSSFKDCYTIISEILKSLNASVYQWQGSWYITRWATMFLNAGSYNWNYTYDDVTTTRTSGVNYLASIGKTKNIKEVEMPLLLSVQRPVEYVKLTYNYEDVVEIMRNLDLQEGTVTSSTSTDIYLTPSYFTQTGRTAKIHKKLNGYGYEYERRIEIDGAADFSDHTKYIKTEDVNMMKDDTFTFKCSYKQENTTSVSGTTLIFQIYLSGLLGTNYTLDDNETWQTGTTSIISGVTRKRIDEDGFYVFEMNTNPLPDSGRVHIKLFIGDATTGASSKAVYRNMTMEYNGVIQNKFKNTKGEFIKIASTNTVKNRVELDQYYNTSWSQLWQGSILNTTGAYNTPMAQELQRYTATEDKSLIELNAVGYYFANYRSKIKLEGSLYGTHANDSGSEIPVGFSHKYMFEELPNKYFALVDLPEIDWAYNTWKGSFLELYDTTIDTDLITYPTAEYQYVSK